MDKVKKVIKEAKKAEYKIDKVKLIKIGLQFISYFTKAKASTSKVLSIAALIAALSNIFIPSTISPEIKNTNRTIEEMQIMYNEIVDIDTTVSELDTISID